MKQNRLLTLFLLLMVSLTTFAQDEYWHQRVSLFDKLPVTSQDIVFLGNSITDGGEFNELFGMENVLNRGIRSDNIRGVKKRLNQVTKGKPAKIFLLIGVNDLPGTTTAKTLAQSYETLVKQIREQSPNTKLYLQGIFPFNNDFKRYKSLIGKESKRRELNKLIKKIAERNGAVYIDLDNVLSEPGTDKLKRSYTNDGLHLLGPGYKAWANAIKQYVTGK